MRMRFWAGGGLRVVVFLALAGALGGAEFEDTGKCMMWEARGANGSAYLLGSLHACGRDIYPLDKAIQEAYDESDTLVLEMDMSGPNQMKAAQLMAQAGMYMGNETMSAALSEEARGKLAEYLKARGMAPAQFDKMKPWFATMVLAMQEVVRLGYDPQNGIDLHFFEKAAQSGKPIEGLETAEEQVAVLSGAMLPIQEKELMDFVDEAGELRGIYEDMAGAWKAGDAAGMKRVVEENLSEDPETKDFSVKLLDERNARMAERIVKLMDEGKKCFVVVGSAHLVGDKSVVRLLEQKGLTVTQVEKAGAEETGGEAEAVQNPAPAGN